MAMAMMPRLTLLLSVDRASDSSSVSIGDLVEVTGKSPSYSAALGLETSHH
jgi:hypothetical protein